MGPGATTVRRATAVLAAAAIAIAGCGGDDEPDPTEAARAAAGAFVGAISEGDFDSACAALTEDLAAQLGGEGCSEQIGAVAGEGDVEIEVTNVRVSGPKAVAETEAHTSDGKQESSLDLVESDGEWLVSGFGD